MTYDYLRDKIINNVWLGKEILKTYDGIQQVVSTPQQWFLNLTPVRFAIENTGLETIGALIKGCKNLAQISSSVGLIFLETAYGINKTFNSRKYTNLAGTGISILTLLPATKQEQYLYGKVVQAYNETLNIPYLDSSIQTIEQELSNIQLIGQSAEVQLTAWQNSAFNKLNSIKDNILSTINSLEGSAKSKAKALLKKIETLIDKVTSRSIKRRNYNKKLTRILSTSTSKAITAIVPGVASVAQIVKNVGAIAHWLLSSFLLKPIADFPAQMLGALTNTVTSIVLKYVGGSGAVAVRYLAASILRTFQTALPAVYAPTGLFAGAWAWLMAYMPYISIAAIIIIIAIQIKEEAVGGHLYIFGSTTQPEPDMVFARLTGATDAVEVRTTLAQLAEEMIKESGRNYLQILGFALDDDQAITSCVNLTGAKPVLIATDQRTNLLAPYLPFITG